MGPLISCGCELSPGPGPLRQPKVEVPEAPGAFIHGSGPRTQERLPVLCPVPQVLDIEQILWAASGQLAPDQMLSPNDVDGLVAIAALLAIWPRLFESDAVDAGQDVDAVRWEPHLEDDARLGQFTLGEVPE